MKQQIPGVARKGRLRSKARATLWLLAPGLPCCLMTGKDDPVQDVEQRGVACVLRKPFTIQQLGQALGQLSRDSKAG
ncbi:MAG: hypothetical protein L0Z62_33195 [Gemmataceae bacterium]|nr:hypothetical protein [Gemmataceae bacterium]